MSTALPPAEVFPPGEYLRDELEERGWSESEFADIIGRPLQALSEILNGRKEITADTAVAFSDALGTSAELWLNLQAAYRLHLIRRDRPEMTPVTRRARLRSLVPVREIQRRGWLPDTDDLDVLEAAVCELLGLTSLAERPALAVAARRSNAQDELTPQQVAWVARVQRKGGGVSEPFDAEALTELAADLARRIHDPADLAEIDSWLSACGVKLVVELPLKGSKIDGVVILSEEGHPIIGLSTRWDRLDIYIFTLLHEIAHLVLGHVRPGEVQLDEDLAEVAGLEAEAAANDLAARWMFPDGVDRGPGHPTSLTVRRIAEACGVHPSLVIGRLQKEGRLSWGELRRSIPKVRPFLSLD
jgi:HTH-type transcriptional regulator / antitoxin HigA